MPKVCHEGSPYGCGHHAEHVEAAKKGWRHRRHDDKLRKDQDNFRAAFGPAEQIHTHASHPGEVRFRLEGKWYSVTTSDYEELSLAGRSIRAAEERDKREADRQAEKERRQKVKQEEVEKRRLERYERAEAKYRERMTREAENLAIREYQTLKRDLRKRGISPSTQTKYYATRGKEVPVDYGEWELLPRELRKRKGGYSLDAAREMAAESAAVGLTGSGIGVNKFDTPDDLIQYIDRMERYTAGVRTRRRNLASERRAAKAEEAEKVTEQTEGQEESAA